MEKTLKQLEENLAHYRKIYKRAIGERRFRTAEGAQQNIDKTHDEISTLKRLR